jgi:hypothetical protein
MGNKNLMAFVVPEKIRLQLEEGARRHGYPSASLYGRALISQSLGVPDVENAMAVIGGLQRRIAAKAVRISLNAIQSLTLEELLADDEE